MPWELATYYNAVDAFNSSRFHLEPKEFLTNGKGKKTGRKSTKIQRLMPIAVLFTILKDMETK